VNRPLASCLRERGTRQGQGCFARSNRAACGPYFRITALIMTANLPCAVSAVCRLVMICWTVVNNVVISPSVHFSAARSAVFFWRWVSAGVYTTWFATTAAWGDYLGETILVAKWWPESAWGPAMLSFLCWAPSWRNYTTGSCWDTAVYFGRLVLLTLSFSELRSVAFSGNMSYIWRNNAMPTITNASAGKTNYR
jgi:hypothetical protein